MSSIIGDPDRHASEPPAVDAHPPADARAPVGGGPRPALRRLGPDRVPRRRPVERGRRTGLCRARAERRFQPAGRLPDDAHGTDAGGIRGAAARRRRQGGGGPRNRRRGRGCAAQDAGEPSGALRRARRAGRIAISPRPAQLVCASRGARDPAASRDGRLERPARADRVPELERRRDARHRSARPRSQGGHLVPRGVRR